MRVDRGELWEQDMVFVSVCNSRYTGGNMLMAPYADTADGELDIVVCGAMDRRTLLATFPKIFSGRHVHHHAVDVFGRQPGVMRLAKLLQLFLLAPPILLFPLALAAVYEVRGVSSPQRRWQAGRAMEAVLGMREPSSGVGAREA